MASMYLRQRLKETNNPVYNPSTWEPEAGGRWGLASGTQWEGPSPCLGTGNRTGEWVRECWEGQDPSPQMRRHGSPRHPYRCKAYTRGWRATRNASVTIILWPEQTCFSHSRRQPHREKSQSSRSHANILILFALQLERWRGLASCRGGAWAPNIPNH